MIETTRTTRRAVIPGPAATAGFERRAVAQGLATIAVTKDPI